jgi:hypothetical protein
MTKLLKAGTLWLAISTVIWLIMIWQWQTSRHEVSAGDIVGQAAAVSDDAQRHLFAWVLAEAVMLAAGADALAAWRGLQARTVRPELDRELQDVDGLPIFTSRVVDLDVDDWRDGHAELVQSPLELSEPVLRGLALLDGPLQQMLAAVSDLVPSESRTSPDVAHAPGSVDPGMKAHLSGLAVPVNKAAVQTQATQAPQLTVRLLLPSSWPDAERAAAVDCVRRQCRSLLDWAEATNAKGVRWLVDALERPEHLWGELDSQMVQWSSEWRPELCLILAVDSAVNEHSIERMQALGELFTSLHQTGSVPGEAAAALLLANEDWPDLAACPVPPVRMWRPVLATRAKSADGAGRVGADVLGAAMQHALSLIHADKDRLLVVSDGDHRASRTTELFDALQGVIPGVDPMLAVTRVGEHCGDLGVARALVPSALACTALRAGERPDQVAVVTHVQSSYDRVVVALAPWRAELIAA